MNIKAAMAAFITVALLSAFAQAAEEIPVKPADVPQGLRDFVTKEMTKGKPATFYDLGPESPGRKWRVEYFRGKHIACLITTVEKIENGKTNTVPVKIETVKPRSNSP